MICPACSKEMKNQDFGGIFVDVCTEGCKGIWFDWLELAKLDEKNEGLGRALQAALNNPRINDSNRPALQCPKCRLPLHSHKHPSDKEINVDECYQCSGFFLDSGELKTIRDNHMTPQERDVYCQKLIAEIPGFKQAEVNLEKQKKRTEAIRHFTRFLRVSYYATGK